MRRILLVYMLLLVTLAAAVGCAKEVEPPPDEVLAVLANVRAGYAAKDMDLFCADFADIMFSAGYTRDTYLQTTEQLHAQLGAWESEQYLGVKDNEYTWRVTFEKSKVKLLLVLDADWRVIGLWFR